ncbi:hypothetical protein BHE74_00022332 [Ensete ventricosum]|nr:hypothetical protein BHE74_00022332 [Ensete ventricosum]
MVSGVLRAQDEVREIVRTRFRFCFCLCLGFCRKQLLGLGEVRAASSTAHREARRWQISCCSAPFLKEEDAMTETKLRVGQGNDGDADSNPKIDASEDTAHQISSDPWYQVGFVLTTGVNSAYVLGYSGSAMVPLGWVIGTTGFILAAAISLYANVLIARLHEVGGKRHIRYRDLAGHIYGNAE